MKTKIKRHSRSVLSVILAISMLISCMMVGLIATDAAKVDSEEAVGDDTAYLIVSTDNNPQNWGEEHNVSSNSQTFEITPSTLGLTKFSTGTNYYVGLSSSKSYSNMYSQGGSSQVGTVSGDVFSGYSANSFNADEKTFNFAHFSLNDDTVSSVTVTTSFSGTTTTYNFSANSSGTTTWSVAGNNTSLFGSAWNTSANDMTSTDNINYTWTKENVALEAGTIEYKIVKNHGWATAYPASNKTKKVDTAGNYNVTVTFNSSTQAMDMTLETAVIPTHTLSVASVSNAAVSATYDGTTITEGSGTLTVPEGETVTITVEPESGYKCSAVTGTYGGNTVSATGAGQTWALTMPTGNTSVSATIDAAVLKKVYFNNYYSRYSMITAYAWKGSADQSTITEEPLGTWPGQTMTRIPNTNTWEIELYNDTTYIIFIGDDGYNTYVHTDSDNHITIPWGTYTNPKYTAGSDKTSPTTNGTWSNYVARSNDYTVTAGSTLDNANIFSAINATFFDYYVDHEVTGGWLTGITAEADYKCTGTYNDPYRTKLNAALSTYATNNSITNPLYFGNNKSAKDNNSYPISLYNFVKRANNADGLSPTSTAIYGLAGNTLAGSTINHYSGTATDYNGARMAMFDEDFLSGENSQNTALATIMHSSAFPVRKTTVTDCTKIYIDYTSMSSWALSGADIYAHFWVDSNTSADVKGVAVSGKPNVLSFDIPGSDYTNVKFYRDSAPATNWWNKSADLTYSGDNVLFTTTNTEGTITGSFANCSYAVHANHTYYEYNSTNGTDNAFITDITQGSNPEDRTAKINYYPASANKSVKSQNDKIGFFPFDYNNIIAKDTYSTDTIYLDISGFTGGSSYWAHFYDGGTAIDTKMTQVSGNLYSVTNPGGLKKVVFTKNSNTSAPDNTWSNVQNETDDLVLPDGSDKKIQYNVTGYNNTKKSGKGLDGDWVEKAGLQPNPKTNGYAQSDHLAHDQGFGVKLEIQFTLGANGLNEDGTAQSFDFSGDDDLWVYVDNKLVLDLGGAHDATTGSINFNTKKATSQTAAAVASGNGTKREVSFEIDNSAEAVNVPHTMTIYYMERGMFDSNLKFGFSFHAIPNMLTVDKKVRTANVNHGFFEKTAANAATDINGDAYKNDQGKDITQFEHTYQGDYSSDDQGVTPSGETFKKEVFNITHGSTDAPSTSDGKVTYSIGSNTTTVTPSGSGHTFNYDLYNDWAATFVGQYDNSHGVHLKETIPNDSLYRYDQSFDVTNVSQNNTTINYSGNNTDGYTFDMPSSQHDEFEDIRVRARFTNQMKVHDLVISKNLNVEGAEAEAATFTIQVLFKFGDYDYTPYKLYCTIDGKNEQMNADGKITLRKNHTVTIKGVPENAKIQIKEILDSDTYGYNSTTLSGAATDQVTIPNGKQFTMGAGDVNAVVKNTKGALTITHQLHANTDALGTCYVSAKVMNGDSEVYPYAETTGELEISPTYIKDDSTYNLEITLRTVPANDASEMDGFYEAITELRALAEGTADQLGLNATVVIDLNNFTATIKFPISKLFNQTTKEQTVTTMPFYSKLSTWKWRMIFDVASYRDLYRNMEYTTGSVPFTDSEWSQMTSTVMGPNQSDVNVPIKDFGKDDQRTAFINSHAPYENGFHNDYTWKTLPLRNNTNKDTDMLIKVNETTKVITYIVKANQTEPGSVYATFQTPYSTSYANNMIPVKDENQDVVQTDYVQNGGGLNWSTAYEGHYTIGGKYVTAPQKILVSGKKTESEDTRAYKYFSYWEVYTVKTDKTSSQLYTKCYSPEFNLTLYQDSIMKAIYNNDTYKSPAENAYADDTNAGKVGSASITFMENSRTQWTADNETHRITKKNGSGGYSNLSENHSYRNGGDRIYTDFLISFTYLDTRLNNSTNTGLTPGLIVQTAGDLPTNETTGLPQTQTQQYYAEHYTGSLSSDAVRTFIEDGPGVKSSGDYLKSEFTLSELDNKNRINYYYSLPNISHSKLEPTTRKNKVYRAYSYLRDESNKVVAISEPVYFSIYDIASIENTADGARYTGGF